MPSYSISKTIKELERKLKKAKTEKDKRVLQALINNYKERELIKNLV